MNGSTPDIADKAARSFIADLVEISADVTPRLEDAERKADQIRTEAFDRVSAACLLRASQSERPGAIRQAARVATMNLGRAKPCGLSVTSARAVIAAGFADTQGTDTGQRAGRGMIRADYRAVD